MDFRIRSHKKFYRRLTVDRLYQQLVLMSGTKHSKEELSRSVRPSTSATEVNIAKVNETMIENPHSTFNERDSRQTFCILRLDSYHFN
jgi:NADP-dependent 3-hydroxy acid dehydrogenase YdfG